MTGRRLIDTNLIVRHLVQDNPQQARAAGRLFEASDGGDLTVQILPVVVAECVFVLESFYKLQRADIARVLQALLRSPGVAVSDLPIQLDALARYQSTKLHFVDCVIAATAVAQGVAIATFDKEFKKFGDLRIQLD